MRLSTDHFTQSENNISCMVVGDIILDEYVFGDVTRISPEAPIPVVAAKNTRYVLGGAANVAGNMCGFRVKTILCGIIGADIEGDAVIEKLSEKGVVFAGTRSINRCTTLKTRIVGMNQQLVRVDRESSKWISETEENELLENIKAHLSNVEYLVLSDYSKGVCSTSFCKKLFLLCEKQGRKIIVDPKSSDWTKYMGAFIVTPNFKELMEAVGCSIDNKEQVIAKYASDLIKRYRLGKILVTRSQHGMMLIYPEGNFVSIKAKQQEVFDVSGAGDTVIATMTAALSVGYCEEEAVEFANNAAGVSVSKAGTYMVSLEDLMEYMNNTDTWYEDKILTCDEIERLVKKWKGIDEKIVFTNGCFDIIHIGHIEYLNRGRRLGTKLIVGLNSDESVKRLKGISRPINSQRERAIMLAALQCVDAVVIFEEDTPENLLSKIRPYYLIKGGDYEIGEIAGRQYAEEVMTIPLTDGFSTTSMIEKIRSMQIVRSD